MKNNLNHLGQITALLSFVIGTCFLAFYLYFGENAIPLGSAVVFIILAIIINSILLMIILITVLFGKTHRLEALKTCVLMLLNIPISILYFYMVATFPYQNILL